MLSVWHRKHQLRFSKGLGDHSPQKSPQGLVGILLYFA
jgi:hypothetical protein